MKGKIIVSTFIVLFTMMGVYSQTTPYEGGVDLNLHHGFEQHRISLFEALLEAHGGAELEGHVAGVHWVEAAIDEDTLDIHSTGSHKSPISSSMMFRVLMALVSMEV